MLIGNVFYYTAKGGRLPDMDSNVPLDYARQASRSFPTQIVVWSCSNGESETVYFRRGKEIGCPAPLK